MSIASNCSIKNCKGIKYTAQYCPRHQQQYRRTGNPIPTFMRGYTDFERICQNLEEVGGCLVWSRSLRTDGYARTWVGNKTTYVHRFMYENIIGPIDKGLVIDHICRNRACANPAHLEVVTQKENVRRGNIVINKQNRKHCLSGHAYNEKNTYYFKGNRQCRVCKKLNQRKYMERIRNG